MARIITVFCIHDYEDVRRDVCTDKQVADKAVSEFGEWHGHGNGKVIERQAIEMEGQLYLLDVKPVIELETSTAVKDAKIALGAVNRLSDKEQRVLGLKT